MGYLTELFKNKIKFKFPQINLTEVLKTSTMSNAYNSNDFQKIDKLLKKGKSYYKSIKFRELNNNSFIHQCIVDSNRNALDICLKQSYSQDPDVIEDTDNDYGFAPVHLACIKDEKEILKDLIMIGKSNINVKTKTDDQSLIHIASQFGALKCIDYLYLNHYRNNINVLTAEKWTPLHFSCFSGKMDVSSYLIENGADLYLRNNQFLTPIDTCILNDNFDLFYALYNFHYDKQKLENYDHPEAAKLTHVAASCKKGNKILEYLLEDPNNINDICNTIIRATPLHFACMQNNALAVRSILRKEPNINMEDYLGNTAIVYATEQGNIDILRMLYDCGADALRKNKEGLNAIQIAMNQENRDVKLFYLGLEKYRNLDQKDYI